MMMPHMMDGAGPSLAAAAAAAASGWYMLLLLLLLLIVYAGFPGSGPGGVCGACGALAVVPGVPVAVLLAAAVLHCLIATDDDASPWCC
jgi:hypothetical protein